MADGSAERPSAVAASSRAMRPCPICGKRAIEAQAVKDYAPFCSKRCADVDLHRWLGGVYAVPTEEAPGDDDIGSGSGGT